MIDNVFLQLTGLLGITVVLAFVVRLLRQPLIIAYIVAGIFAGPVFLNFLHGSEDMLHALAQLGIILLLFIVGLSMNPQHLRSVGKNVLVAGALQFIFTAGFGLLVMRYLDFSWLSSLLVAIAITFSSTIVIVKILTDKRELETVYGRFVIGLLVVQDLIAITILLFFNTAGGTGLWWQVVGAMLIKGIFLAIGIYLAARYVLPVILPRVATSNEFLFIFTIAWCFGVASLVYLAGLSLEVGAIVAGATLGISPFQPEIASRIKPLRDFFIVLFFIMLGSELHLQNMGTILVPGILLTLFVVFIGSIILYLVTRFLGYTRRNAFLIGITAAQVSEFAFIIAFKGQEKGFLGNTELTLLTFVALTTITISSYLLVYNEKIYNWIQPLFARFGKDKYQQKSIEDHGKKYDVLVFGYHRMGWKVCETLMQQKRNFAVVDFDPQAIERLQKKGIPYFFGDATDVEFVQELPLEDVRFLISTIPEFQDQLTLMRVFREKNKKAFVVAALYNKKNIELLYQAGANYVLLPHLMGGQWLAEFVQTPRLTKAVFQKLQKAQERELNFS